MKKKSKGTSIKENEFNQLKSLLEYGVTPAKVAEAMGRAKATVYEIKRSETHEQYVANMEAKAQKDKSQKAVVEVTEPQEPTSMDAKLDKIELKLNQITVAVNILLEEADRQRSHGKVNIWEQ